SAVLWGDALYELCRWDDCESVLAGAADRPGDAADRARLVSIRCTNMLFGLMRGEEAIALMAAAVTELGAGDASLARDLASRVALRQMYGGDPAGALESLGGQPAAAPCGNDDSPPVRTALRSRVLWAIAAVPALALDGRTGDAVALGNEAFVEHAR